MTEEQYKWVDEQKHLHGLDLPLYEQYFSLVEGTCKRGSGRRL
ncbi:hypothetical protein VQ056_18215 [Paenibacillus sp. JTLBN-2024]